MLAVLFFGFFCAHKSFGELYHLDPVVFGYPKPIKEEVQFYAKSAEIKSNLKSQDNFSREIDSNVCSSSELKPCFRIDLKKLFPINNFYESNTLAELSFLEKNGIYEKCHEYVNPNMSDFDSLKQECNEPYESVTNYCECADFDQLCDYVDPCCNISAYLIPWSTWAFGKTVGLEENYHQFGVFLGLPNTCNTRLSIFQGDFVYFDKNLWAGSLGLGMRMRDDGFWGINVFYDYRNSEFGGFHQIGFGWESLLTPCLDLRTNVYLPLSSTKHGDTSFFFFPEGNFEATCNESDVPVYAANGEIGRPFCIRNCSGIVSYAAIGPYFLIFSDEKVFGIRFRAALSYRDLVRLELFTTYDSVFGALVQGQLTLFFPFRFFCGDCKPCCTPCCQDPPIIERFDAIPLRRCCNWTWNW